MVTLEQVKLLETKVGKALAYVETLSSENVSLREKLDGYRRRIDELETVVLAFKEDQGRIEEGILSALDRLSQFEVAVEKGIGEALASAAPLPAKAAAASIAVAAAVAVEEETEMEEAAVEAADPVPAGSEPSPAADEPLEDDEEEVAEDAGSAEKSGELDIF